MCKLHTHSLSWPNLTLVKSANDFLFTKTIVSPSVLTWECHCLTSSSDDKCPRRPQNNISPSSSKPGRRTLQVPPKLTIDVKATTQRPTKQETPPSALNATRDQYRVCTNNGARRVSKTTNTTSQKTTPKKNELR